MAGKKPFITQFLELGTWPLLLVRLVPADIGNTQNTQVTEVTMYTSMLCAGLNLSSRYSIQLLSKASYNMY